MVQQQARRSGRERRAGIIATAALVAGAVAIPGMAAAQSPAADKTLEIAYLSYAIANTYDAPMLAAAQAAAAAGNANITVFDANNDPAAQQTQLQDAVASGKYDGIIVQPIAGAALVAPVQAAIAAGIQVANMDQTLGADLTTSEAQVDGLAANVVFVPSEIGRKLGELTVQACTEAAADPCNVGYIFAFKGYPLDNAIRAAFDAAVAGTPSVKVVAEGEGFFSAQGGLAAGQDMLTAHPDLKVLVGSDQAITGALQAAAGANISGIQAVGFGGGQVALDEVAAGKRYATVMQLPATEGKLAVEQLINAIRTGTPAPGVDPVSQLPDSGVATQKNASEFTAEWPG
ncbi:MAG: sugar ABC transporter substrate-binding protein [Chloroflexota bacterium]